MLDGKAYCPPAAHRARDGARLSLFVQVVLVGQLAIDPEEFDAGAAREWLGLSVTQLAVNSLGRMMCRCLERLAAGWGGIVTQLDVSCAHVWIEV